MDGAHAVLHFAANEEQFRAMLEIFGTFVKGVLDIASGNIKPAADYLEKALSDGIPVAIAFLAKQVGLGDLSEKIQEMIKAAQAQVNKAIDWIIGKAIKMGKAVLARLGLGGKKKAPFSKEDKDAAKTGIKTEDKKIAMTEEELRERVAQMSMMRGVQPRQLIEEMGGDRFLRRLSREIRDKKVLAFLVENAEITEKTVPVEPGES